MNFFDVVKKRYSVRDFLDKPVEREKLEKIFEAVRLAPSAVNYQPRKFIVLTDQEVMSQVHEAYSRDWIQAAPVLIVAIGEHDKAWTRRDGKNHTDIDLAISIDHLTLAATALGLGTCWVCAFDAKKVHSILNLKPEQEVIALIPLGYPASDEIPEKEREEITEFVSWQ